MCARGIAAIGRAGPASVAAADLVDAEAVSAVAEFEIGAGAGAGVGVATIGGDGSEG
jgi:hypothetical protein